jgi:hypothetical protein
VNENPVPTKAELLSALRSSEQELLAKIGALPEEEFQQGRYEKGWTARQILAHVASIEWTYARLLDVARQAQKSGSPESQAAESGTGSGRPETRPTRIAQGGIDAYNQRQVDKRAETSVPDLLVEFQRNRAATIDAVENADEALLATPIQSAGGIAGALAGVIHAVAVLHVLGHVNDIAGSR